MLRHEIHVADGARDGSPVLVMLHGRGADRRDLLGLASSLPEGFVLVTPEAPHPGRPWGYGPGWAWYRYQGGNRVDAATLDASLEALDAFLDGLETLLPVKPGDLVLGGFSQGGTTSLAYALRRPGEVVGVLNFSGFLADGVLRPPATDEAAGRLAAFWGHGTDDPNIPHAMAVEGRAALREAGADVTGRDYPIGHWIAPDELEDALAWVEQVRNR